MFNKIPYETRCKVYDKFGVNEEVCDVMDEKITRLLDKAKKAEVGE